MKQVEPSLRQEWTGQVSGLYHNMAYALCVIDNPILSAEDLNRGQHCLHVSENILSAWTRDLAIFCDEAQELATQLACSFSGLRNILAVEIRRRRLKTDLKSGEEILHIRDDEYCLICRVCGRLAASFMPDLDMIGRKRNILYGVDDSWSLIPENEAERVLFFLKKRDLSGLHAFLLREKTFNNGLKEYCSKCGRIYCSDHRPCACADKIEV